jgi:hypothetical protein
MKPKNCMKKYLNLTFVCFYLYSFLDNLYVQPLKKQNKNRLAFL